MFQGSKFVLTYVLILAYPTGSNDHLIVHWVELLINSRDQPDLKSFNFDGYVAQVLLLSRNVWAFKYLIVKFLSALAKCNLFNYILVQNKDERYIQKLVFIGRFRYKTDNNSLIENPRVKVYEIIIQNQVLNTRKLNDVNAVGSKWIFTSSRKWGSNVWRFSFETEESWSTLWP